VPASIPRAGPTATPSPTNCEHFAAQPETLRYLNHVADRFDFRRDIEFGCFVEAAHWLHDGRVWEVRLRDGRRVRCRFLVTAIGPLSVPTMPDIPGVDRFRGEAHHTGRWPHHPVGFEGRRVAVIGTGATGVQVIQEVAKTAGHLTVFQRRPNWCVPLHNSAIDAATQADIKRRYGEIIAKCRSTFGQFLHDSDPRKSTQVTPAEREAFYEKLYGEPGFGIWMGNFRDLLVDEAANRTISDFVARKIRERVNDPATAEKLIPKDHGFGTRRVPMETRYYEVYNQPNVELVDLNETPIREITPDGIRTSDRHRDFDLIIYATGFDAVIGGFNRIDIRGRAGLALKDKWRDGPRTCLGMTVAGFPNLFTIVGPHNAGTFCNIPRCIEQNVDWVTDLVGDMQAKGRATVEATEAAERAWTDHVLESGGRMLFTRVDSWFMGINSNLAGRQTRTFLLYAAGAPKYREACDAAAAAGYRDFAFG
jgi:cation diffusion facilitator CzcD-associated flavoprotein CzcO